MVSCRSQGQGHRQRTSASADCHIPEAIIVIVILARVRTLKSNIARRSGLMNSQQLLRNVSSPHKSNVANSMIRSTMLHRLISDCNLFLCKSFESLSIDPVQISDWVLE